MSWPQEPWLSQDAFILQMDCRLESTGQDLTLTIVAIFFFLLGRPDQPCISDIDYPKPCSASSQVSGLQRHSSPPQNDFMSPP